MARFLSNAWFAGLARTLSGDAGTDDPGDPHDEVGSLVIQQIVRGTPDGDVRYWTRIDDGRAAVTAGQADEPDVTFTEDYATAAAVARGELTTQAALLGGRIRVSGNLATLAAHHDAIGLVDPLPDALRDATTY